MIYLIAVSWFVICLIYITSLLQDKSKIFVLLFILLTIFFAGGMTEKEYLDIQPWINYQSGQ
jgi:hypothetical protein